MDAYGEYISTESSFNSIKCSIGLECTSILGSLICKSKRIFSFFFPSAEENDYFIAYIKVVR